MEDDDSSQADGQSHLVLDSDSCRFLLCEEVQEIVDNNSTAMDSFRKEKAELLNYIISLTNVLANQDKDNKRLEVIAQAQRDKVSELEDKQNSLRQVIMNRYAECSKKFEKIVKAIEKVDGIKKTSRRRASHTGLVYSATSSRNNVHDLGQNFISEPNIPEGRDSDSDSQEEREDVGELESHLNKNHHEAVKSSSTKRLNKVQVVIADKQADEEGRSLVERAVELKEEMRRLVDLLNAVNERINTFKMGIESKLNEPVTCKNCYKKYTMLNNPPESCRYHPGKVKYFSCKVCGGDEYYTCCRVCKTCNPGCHIGQHVPVIKYSEFKS